jgi:hypothetical protein
MTPSDTEPPLAGQPPDDALEWAGAVLRRAVTTGQPWGPTEETAYHIVRQGLLTVLVRICRAAGLEPEDAIDVVQHRLEDFVLRDVVGVGPRSSDITRWMYKTCHRAARSAAKREGRRRRRETQWYGMQAPTVELDALQEPAKTADDARWLDASLPPSVTPEQVRAAIRQLSPSQRALYAAVYQLEHDLDLARRDGHAVYAARRPSASCRSYSTGLT